MCAEADKNGEFYISEYNNLRNEISTNKKYVLERPVLLIMGAFASLQFIQDTNLSFNLLSPFVISLLLINLWFTINRLNSSSRIIAYIQVFLENRINAPQIGWENFLRKHRILQTYIDEIKSNNKKLTIKVKQRAVPDKNYFYGKILQFHRVSATIFAVYSFARFAKLALIKLGLGPFKCISPSFTHDIELLKACFFFAASIIGLFLICYKCHVDRPSVEKKRIEEEFAKAQLIFDKVLGSNRVQKYIWPEEIPESEEQSEKKDIIKAIFI